MADQTLMDLPPDVRQAALDRMGLTEAQYQEQIAKRVAAAEQAEAERPEQTEEEIAAIPDKFKDTPAGVLGE